PCSRTADEASAISAMIPPSPRLSARMISTTYLSDTTTISAQNTVDRPPRMFACVSGMPCCGENVSLTAYSGLVPMSPNTMPSAATVRAPRVERWETARFKGARTLPLHRTNCNLPRNPQRKPRASSALAGRGSLEERGVLRRRHGFAVEEALHLVAARATQEARLRVGLDALRDHAQPEIVAKRDDRLREHALVLFRGGADVPHERAVDLQLVDGKVL